MSESLPIALLIEDEPQIRRFVRTALEAEGWNVNETDTVRQGLIDAGTRKPELIILDLGLPDGDGMDFLRDLRGWSKVPVIVLSARVGEQDKIEALDAGADDYLTKPFGVGELLARVRAASRRRQEAGTAHGAIFEFGDVKIDLSLRTVQKGGTAIHLTPIEYRLLTLLIANTGKVLWLTQSIQEPLRELGENATGKQRWGPAGASVWNTPTVDARRGLIYVGTGNNFGRVAAATSDSILALRMRDGKMMWHHQEFEGDTFMARCQASNPADSNCPEKLGPDYDFGGSSAILETVDGKDILLAAGKGGVAIALDPDKEGKLLWRTQLWESQAPSASGLVVWGGAADGERVYYPLQQPGGGLKALDIKTGKVEWNAVINADRRGQAGPASAIPGVVFTGGWDGILRAVGTSGDMDGKVIWSFNAVRDFETVNGVPAKGGSFGCAGPVVVGGTVFATSGYLGTLRGTPGNVLLAFGAE